MASIEFIQKRITGAEAKLEKLNKKLERIRKVEAQNWEDPNPYYYCGNDLKWCLRDIEDTKSALEAYKAQLKAENEKANSRNVKVILDFLEMWKDRVRKYYMNGLKDYYRDDEIVRNAYREAHKFGYGTPEYKEAYAKYEELAKQFSIDRHGAYERRERLNRWGKTEKYEVKVADGKYEYLKSYSREKTIEEAAERLENDLAIEATRKYDFIIERTNKIAGTITDASHLKIGAKDDLNGYIVGERGTAKVQTIGAGGYNIQCFHFRTIINEKK